MTLKKVCILTLVAATLIPATARERSTQEMFNAATQVLSRQGLMHTKAVTTSGREAMTMLAAHRQMSIVGYKDGGFALVSRDTSVPDVMGYSTDNYADAAANANFQGYVASLDAYLQHCAETGTEPQFIGATAQYNPFGVSELMKCRWDQGEPYNLMCPTLYQNGEDRRSASGCVATAMAQILYTMNQKFGVPTRARGQKRYFYLDGTYHMAYVTANLATMPMDWANMKPTYSSSANYAAQMAVARLMYACGVASEMYYAPGNSGTYTSTVTDGVNAFFEGVRSEFSGYDLGAFEQRIYDELDEGHPILLTGNNGQGNHAFVADGYDSMGRLHLNMGWSGGGNGFYTIANMNGFSSGQAANFFMPKQNDDVVLSADAPLEELRGLYAAADIMHPCTSMEEGQWYVLYNCGRYSAAYSSGLGKTVQNARFVIGGEPTEVGASMLVRFIAKDKKADSYYIQTGTGDYFGALTNGGNAGSTASPEAAYTVKQMFPDKAPKYFYLKQDGTVMDCNEVGGKGIAGYGTATPADSLGHACWMLLPTHIGEDPSDMNTQRDLFNPEHNYNISLYDGTNNFTMAFKLTCTLSSSAEPTMLRILPHADGWQANVAYDKGVLSAKSSGFKVGNGTTSADTPLTLHFEPTSQTLNTDDAALKATSRIFRIRTEAGYMGCDRPTNLSTVFCNKLPHAQYTYWIVTDRTAYELLTNPEGIERQQTTDNRRVNCQLSTPYDLQGRPATQGTSLIVKDGKKIVK